MDKKIPLMNVARQYKGLQNEIDTVVQQVLSSGNYINGENVAEFEKEFAAYIGVKYGVGVGNGTDALVIALRALGVKAGDEVITCAMSFYATAEAIASVGAKPVFVDCTKDTYVLDAELIEEKITEKTKAIIAVHLYGQCAEMDKICELAKKYKLYVVEDMAQAAGAEYNERKAGTLGDVACISFFPTKNLGAAGDAGIIVTNSEEIARKCRAYRMHGSGLDGLFAYNQEHQSFETMDFGNHPPKYFNYVVGYNSRLDELQAAILRVKLKRLDQWNDRRREIADTYHTQIKNSKILHPIEKSNMKHIFHVYIICTDERDLLREYLDENGIATGVYYPVPLHLQKVFETLGYRNGDFPNAEYVANKSLAIPMFPELQKEEIDKIVEKLNAF